MLTLWIIRQDNKKKYIFIHLRLKPRHFRPTMANDAGTAMTGKQVQKTATNGDM